MPPVRGGSSWGLLPMSTLNPLILVAGQCPLIVRQVREKSEPPDAIGSNSVTVNDDRAVEQLAQVIPVEIPSVRQFLHQARRIESIVSPFSRCEAAFLKTQTKPDPSGRPPTNDQAPCSIGT